MTARKPWWSAGGLLLFTLAAALLRPVSGVALSAADETLLFLPMRDNETLELTWRHSVDHILVRDVFSLRGGTLYLNATYHAFFAAGLGHIVGRGKVISTDNHGLAVIDINEALETLPLRVGSADIAHTLHHRGQRYNLSARYPHRRVQLRAVRIAYARYLFSGFSMRELS